MITTEVAFAVPRGAKSKEFSAGLHDLAQRMPMELVRLYVTEGVRTPRVRIDYYDRIDELRALRREALLAEMRPCGSPGRVLAGRAPRRGGPHRR